MIVVSASEMGDASLSVSIFIGSCSGFMVSSRLSVLDKFVSSLLVSWALPLPVYPKRWCFPFPFGRIRDECNCLLMNSLVITPLKCLAFQMLLPCTNASRRKPAMSWTMQSREKKSPTMQVRNCREHADCTKQECWQLRMHAV